eukprot:12274-Chlamydomonas_euryale.AAC.7
MAASCIFLLVQAHLTAMLRVPLETHCGIPGKNGMSSLDIYGDTGSSDPWHSACNEQAYRPADSDPGRHPVCNHGPEARRHILQMARVCRGVLQRGCPC